MLCFLFKKQSNQFQELSHDHDHEWSFCSNSNPKFSFSENENLHNMLVLILKSILFLFCALFPPLVAFFRCYKTRTGKQPLFEEDYNNEAFHDCIDFDEIETPFSTLSFRFPTYDEFLKTTENNVDSVEFDTSNESEVLEENCSIPSNPTPENSPPNDMNGTNDIRIEDEFDDSVEDVPLKIEDSFEEEEMEIEILIGKAKPKSGLASIPEESEYSITEEEDLKPWKKEESFNNYRDTITELHKFHKLYTENMRKYDTLNHQKTYAKELKRMQSKGSASAGESVVSKGLCGCRPEKKTGENREVEEGELELVYVVQLWVSWEFIVLQYKKALEICKKEEGYGSCSYNEVAEKFVHFQVVIQRFLENESFDEGSRVERFARNRLARRKLLQVPLLKEDEVKGNKKKEGIIDEDEEKENAVKIDRLIRILQESIRILWQFIRADKLAHISTLKCCIEAERGCTTPAHSNILKQILSDLLKKERKVKRIVKRKNWTLKNLKESSEDDEARNNGEVYFLAMVDLRLVTRVLNMHKITRDQLSWCHHKLSCITFPNGNIQMEPSSFLFPSS